MKNHIIIVLRHIVTLNLPGCNCPQSQVIDELKIVVLISKIVLVREFSEYLCKQ